MTAFVLAVSSGLGFAQELPWQHITPDHQRVPLPSASVQTVMQDRDSYVWLGFFSAGLARYDGQGLEVYDVADGLADSTVRQAVQDARGRLWVGSESGLVASVKSLQELQPGERVRFVSELGGLRLVRTRIRHNWVAADPTGAVWVGTAGEGVLRYDVDGEKAEVRSYTLAQTAGGREETVSALAARRDGTLLVATEERSLAMLRPGAESFERLPAASRPEAVITALFEGRSGTVWGGCRDGSLFRFDGQRAVAIASPLADRVSTLVETAEGELWVGSLGGGLLRLPVGSGAVRIGRREGLPSESVWEILEDREGNLWVAHNAGVSRLRPNHRAFSHYTGVSRAGERAVLPEPSVFAVLPPGPRSGLLWAGTGGGLAAITPGGESFWLAAADGLHSSTIYSLARDPASRVWVGTLAGLAVLAFDGEPPPPLGTGATREVRVGSRRATLRSYETGTVYETKLFDLAEADLGKGQSVWLTGPNGLVCFADGAWYRFGVAAGLPASGSASVAVDDVGRVWVGSRDSGVLRSTIPVTLDLLRGAAPGGGEVRRPLFEPVWNRALGARSDSVHNLAWAGGRMWVATAAGLAAMAGEPPRAATVLDREQGLGGDRVMGMAVTPGGSLWVTNNAGIAEVDPADARVLRLVSRRDGLIDDEVWVSASLAYGADGAVYLGTPKGLSIYRPGLDTTHLLPPVLRFGRVSFTQDHAGNNQLDAAYRALSFGDEAAVRFRTRLAGYERTWSEPSTDAKIRYTNLPAFLFTRSYAFEFTAGARGAWAEPPLRTVVRVRPAWWKRWWAMLIWASAAVAAGRVVTRRLRDRNRELARRVAERTAQLEQASLDRRAERAELERALAASSQRLAELARQMSALAEATAGQAGTVSTSAEEVNAHVQSVSTAVEELSANAREIASSAAEAARIASSGVNAAASTHRTIAALAASSEEIDKVVASIDAITRRTNMLALNATIEAARAGERGKGFVVVAGEVKALASQTAAATGEVRARIEAIRADAARSVAALSEIGGVIGRINDIQVSIASAVEEHTATTSEIAGSVASAAAGSAQITAGIAGVAQAADGTTRGAADALAAAAGLADLAGRLADDRDPDSAQSPVGAA